MRQINMHALEVQTEALSRAFRRLKEENQELLDENQQLQNKQLELMRERTDLLEKKIDKQSKKLIPLFQDLPSKEITMKDNAANLTLKILEKTWEIPAGPENVVELQQAAVNLTHYMQRLQQACSITNYEQLAVLAGVHLARDLMQLQQTTDAEFNEANQQIKRLIEKMEQQLTETTEPAL